MLFGLFLQKSIRWVGVLVRLLLWGGFFMIMPVCLGSFIFRIGMEVSSLYSLVLF